MSKKTVVIGASGNPERYAYRATVQLNKHGHPVIPVGLRDDLIADIKVLKGFPPVKDVDTVTLYVGPANQPYWYDYILELKPKRIIFNPGTENPELEQMARNKGIEVQEACTLVLLSLGDY
jgi:predicted CoA-binding protein